MDSLPSYYRAGSRLSVNRGTGVPHASFTVVKPIAPFTMSQVLLVKPNSGASPVVLKVYDPRFTSNRFQGKIHHPWDQEAEIQAQQRLRKEGYQPPFPYWPERGDKVGWEEWYFLEADRACLSEIAAYNALTPLQGDGVPRYFGSGYLNLPERPFSPRVFFLEYLPNAQDLQTVATRLITPQVINALNETVSAFGRLGVAHCDLHYGNILFLVGENGIHRAVIIDFGSSCVRKEGEPDAEWDFTVDHQGDSRWLQKRLKRMLRERP